MDGCRAGTDYIGGPGQFFRSLILAIGMDDFGSSLPLRFRLPGDGSPHTLREVHLFRLYKRYLDSPWVGLPIQNLLKLHIDPVPLRKQLIQINLPNNASQGGLSELRGGIKIVFDLDNGFVGIHNAKIDDGVHPDRDIIMGDDILGGNVQRHGPEADFHQLVNKDGLVKSRLTGENRCPTFS